MNEYKIRIETKTKGVQDVFDDEIIVEFVSAMGQMFGYTLMPKSMEKGLIETYKKSKAYNSDYMYINGKEIKKKIN